MENNPSQSAGETQEYLIAPKRPLAPAVGHHLLEQLRSRLATQRAVQSIKTVGNPFQYLLVRTDARTSAALQAEFAESLIVEKNANLRLL